MPYLAPRLRHNSGFLRQTPFKPEQKLGGEDKLLSLSQQLHANDHDPMALIFAHHCAGWSVIRYHAYAINCELSHP